MAGDTPAAPTTPRTDESLAEYVRHHQCWQADPNVTIADWHRGILAIEAEAATRSTPAEPLDVERLTKAMDFDRVEALSIIEKHGFVFATDLSKPIESRTDAERWEALAFTLYTMLLPSNRRSERIADEYARLRSPESD